MQFAVDQGVDTIAGYLKYTKHIVEPNRNPFRHSVEIEDDGEEKNIDGKLTEEEGEDHHSNQGDCFLE